MVVCGNNRHEINYGMLHPTQWSEFLNVLLRVRVLPVTDTELPTVEPKT